MKTQRRPTADERIRMYFRVLPKTRARFRAVASLHGETMEDRMSRLMEADIQRHLPEPATAAAG